MATIKTLVVKLVGDVAGFQQDMQRGAAMVEQAGRNMQSAGANITAGFTVPVAAGAYVVGDALFEGVNQARDLQAQMSGVQAILGITAKETAKLQGLVEDLAIDPNLKVNAQDAAAAVEMLARNGLGVEQIMGGAARGVVLLSNATGGDFSQSADMVTDVMALWKMEANQLETAVDGITSVVNNSKFGVNDYALALAQGGGVAAAVGVEFSDFNTSIAAMSPLFASGADAGTSFKTMLQRLVPQTNSAIDAMQNIGLAGIRGDRAWDAFSEALDNLPLEESTRLMDSWIESGGSQAELLDHLRQALNMNQTAFGDYIVSTGILETAFHDANGAMLPMEQIAGNLEDALSSLNEQQKVQALSTIFGTDAMRAAVGLADTGAEGFRELAAAMGDISAAENAATRIDNLNGDLEIFDSVMGGVQLQMGALFLPLMRQMVQEGTNLVTTYGPIVIDMLPGFVAQLSNAISSGGLFVGWLVSAVQNAGPLLPILLAVGAGFMTLLAVLGPLLLVVGTMVTGIGALAGIFTALAGPVGLAIALGAALYAAWTNNFMGIRDIVSSAIEWIRAQLSGLDPPVQLARSAIATLRDVAGSLYERVSSLNFSAFREGAASVIQLIQNLFAPTIGRLRDRVGLMTNSFALVSPKIVGLQGAFGRLLTALRPVATFVGVVIIGAFNLFLEIVAGVMPRVGAIVGGVVDAAIAVIDMLAGVITGLVDLVVALVNGDWAGAWAAAESIVDSIVTGIVGLITGLGTSVVELVMGLVDGVIAWFHNMWDVLVGHSIVPDTVNEIIDWFVDLKERGIQKTRDMIELLLLRFIAFKSNWLTIIEDAVGAVVGWFEQGKTWLIEKSQAAIEGIQTTFRNVDWAAVGVAIIQGIANGIASGIGIIVDAARNAANSALNAAKAALGIQSPSKKFAMLGGYSAEGYGIGFINRLTTTARQIQSRIGSVVDGIAIPSLRLPGIESPTIAPEALTVDGLTTVEPGVQRIELGVDISDDRSDFGEWLRDKFGELIEEYERERGREVDVRTRFAAG